MGVSTNTVVQAMRKIMARDYAYPGVRKEIVNSKDQHRSFLNSIIS